MNKIDFNNKLILAPLAGYTDRAFRELAVFYGADIVYTEMISSTALYRDDKKTKELANISDFELSKAEIGAQIFGHDGEIIKHAVEYLNKNEKISIIDLNLGCPAPKIVKNGDGSALLEKPDLVYSLLKTIKNNTDKTVTSKMRLGINGRSNYLEIAKAAEDAKIDALIVHGRTREEMYQGQADWEKILEIKNNISIPVIGNGDINNPEIAKTRLNQTNGIMIGRGAIGKPWIFKEIKEYINTGKYSELSLEEKFNTIIKHINLAVEIKGEKVGVLEMRKHLHSYLKGMENSTKVKNEINSIIEVDSLIDAVESYRDYLLTTYI